MFVCYGVFIYTNVHAYMCMCIHVYCMYTCVLYAYMCICIHVYMHTCVYAYMCICIHVYMHTCVYAYMCICIRVYMHTCVLYACELQVNVCDNIACLCVLICDMSAFVLTPTFMYLLHW